MADAAGGMTRVGGPLAEVERELQRLLQARAGRRELVEEALAPPSSPSSHWPDRWGPEHVVLATAPVKLTFGERDLVTARGAPPWGECRVCTEGQVVRQDDEGREWSVPCRCDGLRRLVARIARAGLPAKAELDDWRLETLDWARLEAGLGDLRPAGPDMRSRARVVRADGMAETIPVEHAVRNFVDGWAPGRRGMLIQGTNGLGKSHLAAGIARALLFAGVGVRWLPWADYLARVRATFGDDRPTALDDARRPYVDCELLIVEELGGKQWTEWGASELEELIYQRHGASRTTVVTTNLTFRQDPDNRATLVGYVGERAASRLLGDSDVVAVFGEDWRRRHLAAVAGGVR